MAIQKRRRVKTKPQPKKRHTVKPSPFQRKLTRLYNRLQDGDTDAILEVSERAGIAYNTTEEAQAIALMRRFDTKIETLQLNYRDDCVSYRVTMRWTDYEAKPHLGYLHPAMTVVSTSPSMSLSVILSYVQLCKRAGKML